MKESIEYAFESVEGTFNDRFVLHFGGVATDIEQPVDDVSDHDGIDVTVRGDSELIITCAWDNDEKIVAIYSIDGMLVSKETMNGQLFSKNLHYKSGIYIVKVSSLDKSYQEKVRIGQ